LEPPIGIEEKSSRLTYVDKENVPEKEIIICFIATHWPILDVFIGTTKLVGL
jgi:hypothetical protein